MLEVNFSPFPTLETERLILREVTHADDNDIYLLRSDRELMRHIDRPMTTTLEEAQILVQRMIDLLKSNEGITWGLTLKNSPGLIGTFGFWRIEKDNHRAEVGYMLHSKYQRQGIMKEAFAKALEYGFKTLKFHSLEANINPGNVASRSLVESLGFVQEAHFKENYYFNGKFLDSTIYSLLNPDE